MLVLVKRYRGFDKALDSIGEVLGNPDILLPSPLEDLYDGLEGFLLDVRALARHRKYVEGILEESEVLVEAEVHSAVDKAGGIFSVDFLVEAVHEDAARRLAACAAQACHRGTQLRKLAAP